MVVAFTTAGVDKKLWLHEDGAVQISCGDGGSRDERLFDIDLRAMGSEPLESFTRVVLPTESGSIQEIPGHALSMLLDALAERGLCPVNLGIRIGDHVFKLKRRAAGAPDPDYEDPEAEAFFKSVDDILFPGGKPVEAESETRCEYDPRDLIPGDGEMVVTRVMGVVGMDHLVDTRTGLVLTESRPPGVEPSDIFAYDLRGEDVRQLDRVVRFGHHAAFLVSDRGTVERIEPTLAGRRDYENVHLI